MEKLTYKDGVITRNKVKYEYKGFDLIDDLSVHLFLGSSIVCFYVSETTINGESYKTVEELLSALPVVTIEEVKKTVVPELTIEEMAKLKELLK